jgi:hypothetical protein
VLAWINEVLSRDGGLAEWLRSERTLGNTVVNQDLYDLADDVHQPDLEGRGQRRLVVEDRRR